LSQSDCIIVGSGVAGLASALRLAEAGWRVTILEREEIGREASWAGGGILCPLYGWRYPEPVMRLAAAGIKEYRRFAEKLMAHSSTDPELFTSGMLILDPGSSPTDRSAASAWASDYGIQHQWQDAIEHFPHLPHEQALWLPDIETVRNPRLLQALTETVRRAGVDIRAHTPVHGLIQESNRITGVHTDNGKLTADHVLITAGAWSGQLMPGMTTAEIFPVRGQMIRFNASTHTGLPTILMDEGVYLIPRRDGSVVVGSTVEYVGFDKHTTDEAMANLHRKAIALWPNLARAPIAQQWSGLRPGTRDEIPYIGTHPEVEGLYISTGFYRNGLAMAPAVAEIITDVMLDRPKIDLSDYRIDRK
jgi:glycine oxidase